jgi:hypothetical protein
MGRERCLLCGRFIFDGDDTSRPPTLGLTVHRHCYRRDAGLDLDAQAWHSPTESSEDSDDTDDS